MHLADADEALGPLWVRLVVFFAVTTLSALAYERLLHDPPVGVAFAVAAAATVCGAALSVRAGGGRPDASRRAKWSACSGGAGRRCPGGGAARDRAGAARRRGTGAPARALALGLRWRAAVEGGLGPLGAWNWPYLGSSHWARLTVLMLLVPATTVMALLFFWPTRAGAAARRLCGLAIAVALALCGMTNSPGGGWRVEGLLLVAVVFAWLWSPTMRRLDAGRALRWTVACAAGALILAPLASGSHSWISFAANEGANPTAFQWDQLYGPGSGPHSHNPTLLNVRATAAPGLLRVTSLDRFDGLRFIRSDSPPDTAATDIPASAESRSYQTATITIAGLRSSLLVGAAGITTHVSWQGRRAPALQRNPDGTLSLNAPLGPRQQLHRHLLRAETDAGPDGGRAVHLPELLRALHRVRTAAAVGQRAGNAAARTRGELTAAAGAARARAGARHGGRRRAHPRLPVRPCVRPRQTPGGGCRLQLRSGRTGRALPALGPVHLRRTPPARALPARGVPVRKPPRLLRAVLRRDDLAAAHGRDPDPGRGRVQARAGRGRRHADVHGPDVDGQRAPGARLGRSLLQRHRLGRVRPDAGVQRQRHGGGRERARRSAAPGRAESRRPTRLLGGQSPAPVLPR